jgi:hypothetical protein
MQGQQSPANICFSLEVLYMSNSSSSRNQKAVPEARTALQHFKYEVANEIGVKVPESGYWGDMTSRECGSVGGFMVKKMIEMAEEQLLNGNR